MSRKRVYLFDTTLRERPIALTLDALSLNDIEGGWLFSEHPPSKASKFVAGD